MKIVCPACAAAYEIPANRLQPGQVVRCARCGGDWTPLEPEPEPLAAEPEPEPEPLPPPEPPAPEPPAPIVATSVPEATRPRVSALAAAWALSIAAVVALVWGAFAGREAVMHAWPPSTRAYAALGLANR